MIMVENWEILFYQKGWWGTSLYGGHILPPPDCNRLGLTNLPENDEDQSSPNVAIHSAALCTISLQRKQNISNFLPNNF